MQIEIRMVEKHVEGKAKSISILQDTHFEYGIQFPTFQHNFKYIDFHLKKAIEI